MRINYFILHKKITKKRNLFTRNYCYRNHYNVTVRKIIPIVTQYHKTHSINFIARKKKYSLNICLTAGQTRYYSSSNYNNAESNLEKTENYKNQNSNDQK